MTRLLTTCLEMLAIAWRQHRAKTVAAIVLMLSGAIALPMTGLALRWLTNEVRAGRAGTAAVAGGAVALFALVGLTFSHFAHIAYFELSELSVLDMDERLIALTGTATDLRHQDRPDYVDKLSMVRRETQRFNKAMESLLGLAGVTIGTTVTTVLLTMVEPALLGLVPLAVIPLLTGSIAEKVRQRAELATATSTRQALGLFRLATTAGPAGELRVFRMGTELLRRHRELWSDASRRLERSYLAAGAVRMIGQLVFAGGYSVGVALVVWRAAAGSRTVGDVVLAIVLAVMVNQQVSSAASLLADLQRMASTFRWLHGLEREVGSATTEGADRHPPTELHLGIDLVDVSFSYPGRDLPALKDVTLSLPAGSTVAIVGENGAGKTSLVKLICGLYPPSYGAVLVDGVDLREFDPEEWHRCSAAGFQDSVRFELPARESVGVGDVPTLTSDRSERAVFEALGRAHASDLLARLDQGLETQLGKTYADGAELSGGQWQKVALGRAFMRETPLLLVLDEPSAALDPRAEDALFRGYTEQAKEHGRRAGAITLLVTHRFTTVRSADLIVVLADGQVAEVGSHTELMRSDGLYAELSNLQASAYVD